MTDDFCLDCTNQVDTTGNWNSKGAQHIEALAF